MSYRAKFSVDLSEPSARALEYALALAERLGVQVDVVHDFQFPTFAVEDGAVALPPYLQENLSQQLRERLEEFVIEKAGEGSKASAHVREGLPYLEIMEAAKGQDLIVMGTHAHRRVAPVVGESGGAGGARFRGPGADHSLGGLVLMP